MGALRAWAWIGQIALAAGGTLLLFRGSAAGLSGAGSEDSWVVLVFASTGILVSLFSRWIPPRRGWAAGAIGAFGFAAAWAMLTAVGAGSAPMSNPAAGWGAVIFFVAAIGLASAAFPSIDYPRRASRARRRWLRGYAIVDVVADLQWMIRRGERELGPEHPDALGTRLHLALVLVDAERFDVVGRILDATREPVLESGDAGLVAAHAELSALLREVL